MAISCPLAGGTWLACRLLWSAALNQSCRLAEGPGGVLSRPSYELLAEKHLSRPPNARSAFSGPGLGSPEAGWMAQPSSVFWPWASTGRGPAEMDSHSRQSQLSCKLALVERVAVLPFLKTSNSI